MQAARDSFLAGARFPPDQHIGLAGRQALQCAAQLLHGQRTPQQLVLQHIPALQLLAQAAHLQHQATALQRAAHGFQALGRKRLFQKIGSAILHGLHGHGDIAMPGDEITGSSASSTRTAASSPRPLISAASGCR
jgi:hypothetical protein